jgi:hypothetical protein
MHMVIPMNENWQEIIKKALELGLATSKGAVPGAKLRQIIARIAPHFNEQYPPAGQESERFSDFLRHFGSLLTVLPRIGQDILVAPFDKPELLNTSGQTQLREDIFEAFTRIPRETPPKEPWYERNTDKFRWATVDEILPPLEYAKIPPATFEQELDDRRAFASSPEFDPEIRDSLLATLQDHAALWAFSGVVRERGLAHKWHFFRFRALVLRIRNWCTSEGLEWREDWLRSRTDQPSQTRPSNLSDLIDGSQNQYRVEGFMKNLSDEDVKRISVPLDIVLKLLQK